MKSALPCAAMPSHRRAPGQAGFSLIELMIAMLIGLLIIAGAISVLFTNKQTYITSTALGQVQDNTRISFELLARDLRASGLTGCGINAGVANVLNNGPNAGGTAWYADIGNAIRGYDANTTDPAVTSGSGVGQRVASTSSIEIVGADGAGASLASLNPTNNVATLNEGSTNVMNLLSGDFVVLCDPYQVAIAQATSYNSSTSTLTMGYGVGSPGNCSLGLASPTVCGSSTGNSSYTFTVNAMVAKLYAADWFIGYNKQGGTSLYRMGLVNTGGVPTPTAQEMVRNATNLTIKYHLTSGASFVTATAVGAAANWASVDAVSVVLTLQGVGQQSATSIEAGNTTQNISRQITTTIALRNRLSS